MLAMLSARTPATIVEALRDRGYTVLALPPFDALAAPVCDHADMLLCTLGKRLFCPGVYAEQSDARAVLDECCRRTGLELFPLPENEKFSPIYPNDVKLNALVLGSRLYARLDAISPALCRYAETAVRLKLTDVRQGYTRCSTAPVAPNAIITADRGIADAAHSAGHDVLLIEPGHIALPGYDYGFIGGATGYDATSRVLYLCGSPDAHPDWQSGRIPSFCQAHGCEVVILPHIEWLDVGGIRLYSENA